MTSPRVAVVWVCAAVVCASGVMAAAQRPRVTPEGDEPFAACVHRHSGRTRVIHASESCRPNETRIPWTISDIPDGATR